MSEEFDDFEELNPPHDNSPNSKVPGNKVNVLFQSTIGPQSHIEKMLVSLEASISDIKYTISNLFDLDADDFHLVHAGRTLDVDDILSNFEVEEGDTILIIPISTAGI